MKCIYISEAWRLGCRLCEYNCAFTKTCGCETNRGVLVDDECYEGVEYA